MDRQAQRAGGGQVSKSYASATLYVGDEPITVGRAGKGALLHVGHEGIFLGSLTAANRIEAALREARMLLREEQS